jgi:hypothetical protein
MKRARGILFAVVVSSLATSATTWAVEAEGTSTQPGSAGSIIGPAKSAVVAGVAGGRKERFAIRFGRSSPQSAVVTAADGDGLSFRVGGLAARLPWDRLDPGGLAALAHAYLPGDSLDRLAVVRFCIANDLEETARAAMDRLLSSAPGQRDSPDVQSVLKELDQTRATRAGTTAARDLAASKPAKRHPGAASRGAPSSIARAKGKSWSAAYRPSTLPRTGYYNDWLKDPVTDASIIKYAVWAPSNLPKKRELGLIVAFHGATGNEASHSWLVTSSTKRTGIEQDYVVLGGKSKGVGWTAADEEPVMKLIEWAIETYPIDRRRVIFHGYSSGAMMIGRWGTGKLDLIAGAVTVAGKYRLIPHEKNPLLATAEFYLVHGDKDSAVGVAGARVDSAAFDRSGYRHVYRELAGLDHTSILNSTSDELRQVYDDSARWLNWQRHGQIPPSTDDLQLLDGLASRDVEEVWGDAAAVASIRRIGGEEAGVLVLRALASDNVTVRLTAAASCAATSFGAKVEAALLRLLSDDATDVRAGAAASLSILATWRHQDSQSALVRLATDTRRPVDDRMLGVEGLAKTVRLQIVGSLADGLVFKALIDLLRDDDRGRVPCRNRGGTTGLVRVQSGCAAGRAQDLLGRSHALVARAVRREGSTQATTNRREIAPNRFGAER